jgi:GT2 family glycosyltransferase
MSDGNLSEPIQSGLHGPSPSEVVAFDEAAYLRENPDVAVAINRGDVQSAYAHYLAYGLREGRLPPPAPGEPRQRLIRTAALTGAFSVAPEFAQFFETLVISRGGGIMLIGWIDDASDPIDSIRVYGPGWRIAFDGAALARVRRPDVEDALGAGLSHPYGYYGMVFSGEAVPAAGACQIEICLRSGRTANTSAAARLVDDVELRDLALSYISAAHHFGNPHVKAIAGFDRGAGGEIVRLNQSITRSLLVSPYVERFGREGGRYDGSLIICLYGKPEFLFLQAALYSAVPGIDRYELVFVSNSPEMAEVLLREAKASHAIYGLDITVVILAGNAGFGAANNIAVQYARSDRVLIVNPDVLPMDGSFAERHSAIVASAPEAQTRLFGAPLYYDDGSLMHGGMFFELDKGLAFDSGRHRVCQLIRVEHYGKGSPPSLDLFTRARPVPAITGAFMSCQRGWFERLGGFTEDYVFGHYEDADLCLKSLQAGYPAWMQDLRLWHLEGKGSTRLPVHEGGSLVNRWLFSLTWGEAITAELLGQTPAHPGLRGATPVLDRPAAMPARPPRDPGVAAWPPGLTTH